MASSMPNYTHFNPAWREGNTWWDRCTINWSIISNLIQLSDVVQVSGISCNWIRHRIHKYCRSERIKLWLVATIPIYNTIPTRCSKKTIFRFKSEIIHKPYNGLAVGWSYILAVVIHAIFGRITLSSIKNCPIYIFVILVYQFTRGNYTDICTPVC